MSRIITVDDLVSQVRSLLDEDNTSRISDTEDILPALNRGQDYATHLLSQQYGSPLLKHALVTTTASQKEIAIPEDAFEERVIQLEVKINNVYYKMEEVPVQDIHVFEHDTQTSRTPRYYAIVGRNIKLVAQPNSAFSLRIWYHQDPLPLVKSQGRITSVTAASQYFNLDSVGSSLTTTVDDLNSYINVIDPQTGLRKASFQIQQLPTGTTRVVTKTTPTRSTVRNITIDTDMSSLAINSSSDNDGPTDYSIEPDDLVCTIHGSCVPIFAKPISNFIVNYAVMELNRKLGVSDASERDAFQILEEQVKDSWANRPRSGRVKLSSSAWDNKTTGRRNTSLYIIPNG